MKKLLLTTVLLISLSTGNAMAHCEIPCGIYDDSARIESILEHAKTIEKSMHEINELSEAEKPGYHTISRWTANKEHHADLIQEIAAQYFLTQRVKVPAQDAPQTLQDAYIKHTTLLHQIMVKAMKTKQTTDMSHVNDLRDLTDMYKTHYFKKHGHEH